MFWVNALQIEVKHYGYDNMIRKRRGDCQNTIRAQSKQTGYLNSATLFSVAWSGLRLQMEVRTIRVWRPWMVEDYSVLSSEVCGIERTCSTITSIFCLESFSTSIVVSLRPSQGAGYLPPCSIGRTVNLDPRKFSRPININKADHGITE